MVPLSTQFLNSITLSLSLKRRKESKETIEFKGTEDIKETKELEGYSESKQL